MHMESASDRVLQNGFLVHEILQHFELKLDVERSSYRDVQENKKNLCNAARISRTFCSAAQDLLWRTLDSVLPLFKILPNFQRIKDQIDPVSKAEIWAITKPLTAEDVERLRVFGSRIRVLSKVFRYYADPVIEPSAILTIASALNGRPFLPNLRRFNMELQPNRATDVLMLPLLRSPSIQELCITSGVYQESRTGIHDISLFLQQLEKSTVLKNLRINVPINQDVLNIIPSCKNIVLLKLVTDSHASIDTHFLSSLSRFEQLVSLNISSVNFSWSNGFGKQGLHFAKLSSFTLKALFEDALTLFSTIRSPCVTDICYKFILPESPHTHVFQWARLFTAIKDSSSALYKLTLKPVSPSPASPYTRVERFNKLYGGVPFDEFSHPLLGVKFEHLDLNFSLFQSLTMNDLKRMAGAWPDLNALYIRCATHNTVDTNALSFICKKFRRLGELLLHINAGEIAQPLQIQATHGLERIYLGLVHWDETQEKVAKLASLLDSLFPDLNFVGDVFDGSDALYEYVQNLQAARLRQRKCILLEAKKKKRLDRGLVQEGKNGVTGDEDIDDGDEGLDDEDGEDDW